MEESYGFKALHFENKKPQMNPCERRFEATGNTDDADLADFHRYEIRVICAICVPSETPGIYHLLNINHSAPTFRVYRCLLISHAQNQNHWLLYCLFHTVPLWKDV